MLIITAQYQENYGINNEVPTERWKNKFSPELHVKLSADVIMYSTDEELIKLCKRVCKNCSNEAFRYTFMSYEVRFMEPIVIENGEKFLRDQEILQAI